VAAQPIPNLRLTPDEYLAIERAAETKSEYWDGEMFAMSGASRKHGLAGFAIATELGVQLRGRPCEAFIADMRVRMPKRRAYVYPDVVVACDEPQFEDDQLDTLLNPTLVIEILSPSTANFDRGHKFQHYRTIASLQEYVLVHQDAVRVEHYRRQSDFSWVLREFSQLDDTLELPSIGCQLRLEAIYEKLKDLLPDADRPAAS
jgi:Uma2 family endonuclease